MTTLIEKTRMFFEEYIKRYFNKYKENDYTINEQVSRIISEFKYQFAVNYVYLYIIRDIIGVSKCFILASFWPASLSFLTFNFIGFWKNFRFHRETCCMWWIFQIVVIFATLNAMYWFNRKDVYGYDNENSFNNK